MGISERRKDRLLTAGQADGERLRGELQRNLPIGVSEHALVRDMREAKALIKPGGGNIMRVVLTHLSMRTPIELVEPKTGCGLTSDLVQEN
jgi:hypothetical protein